MTRRDPKGNPRKPPDHVRLYGWLMDSAAWKDLTTEARALYVLLKQQFKGMNNGRLILSVRQAADSLHIGKSTAANAFTELIEHGFIEVVIRGSFGGRKDRRATEWRLTEYGCDLTGELATKLFMRWHPGRNFTVRPEGHVVPERGPKVPEGGLSRAHIPRTVPQRGL